PLDRSGRLPGNVRPLRPRGQFPVGRPRFRPDRGVPGNGALPAGHPRRVVAAAQQRDPGGASALRGACYGRRCVTLEVMTLTPPAEADEDAVVETFTDWATGRDLSLYEHQEEALL